jgi:hypothetical protein
MRGELVSIIHVNDIKTYDPAARTCGECTACCVAFDVGALDKPAGVACRHLRVEGGCGVYSARPEVCRAFACAWLSDATWKDDERPDELGVLIAPADQGDDFARSAGMALLVAYELRPGAFDAAPAKRLLNRLARHRLVALVRHGWERRAREPSGYVGPPELLASVARHSRRSCP